MLADASCLQYDAPMSKYSFPAIIHLLRAQSFIQERLSGGISAVHGISLSELMLLMFLDSAPGGRLSRVELARSMNVSASTVTRQLAPLEKRGIVSKDSDARDARLSYVLLTEPGRELARDGRQSLEAASAHLFQDRWTAKEEAMLAELLGRFTANLPGTLK